MKYLGFNFSRIISYGLSKRDELILTVWLKRPSDITLTISIFTNSIQGDQNVLTFSTHSELNLWKLIINNKKIKQFLLICCHLIFLISFNFLVAFLWFSNERFLQQPSVRRLHFLFWRAVYNSNLNYPFVLVQHNLYREINNVGRSDV